MLKDKKTLIMFIIWALSVPISVYYTYQQFPLHHYSLIIIISYFVLAGIVSYFPVVINNISIYLFQWVTLAGFLFYGLFFEVILSQFSILVVLISSRVEKERIYRYPLNSLMFLLISVFSGLAYYAVGGKTGIASIDHVFLPIIVYMIVNFIINQLCYYASGLAFGNKISLLNKELLWEFLIIWLVTPLSIILFYLTELNGFSSFLLTGMPFVGFAYVLRLYNSSEKINDYLQKAAGIGHQLTEKLEVNEVLDLFIQKISQTLTVDYAYILDIKGDEMILLRGVENGQQKPNIIPPIKKNEGISGQVWATEKPVCYNHKREWEKFAAGYMPENVESIICVPIFREKKVEAVLFLASRKKRQYEKYQISILDILCSYFVVAISNARHYEHTKMNSEHCSLTKLYNYRYFESLLTKEFESLNKGLRKELSLIMLDIDSFKMINDTYGHQSGNDILVMMAKRLKSLVGNRGTVARYGGEEFVILLTDTNKHAALRLAELVRLTIANRPFIIDNSLDEEMSQVSINITVSIGVATAPFDGDEALALIRHADRALYIGAKRAGKNRVAEYVK